MKIFHINMHNAWGGQPNRILTKSRETAKLGHEVWISGPRDCELVRRAQDAGLKTFDDLALRRGFRPASMWRDVRNLRRLFREQRFDIVHTHGSQDTWAVAFALRGLNPRPAFVRTRHNIFPIAGHMLNQWLYRNMIDHVITVSPQVNVYLESKGLKRSDEITAIYSAPDQERFHPGIDGAGVRDEFGFAPDDIVTVCVGRLAPEKGHVHLVDAAAKVRERFPQARFLFAGKGRSRPEIEQRIAEHGLDAAVVLAGFRTDVPRLLAASDIFVLSPVDGESLGTAILEGFLMELPAVATDVGGVRESVRDGETGFLVAPARPDELAEALAKLLGDRELRRKMGRTGREMVLREFTPEQLATQTLEIYDRLLARRSRA